MLEKSTKFPLLVGLLIVLVWGTSFICSKQLVLVGIKAHEAYFMRALISYVCLVLISHNRLLADSWKDELMLALLGISGGSLYYVLENLSMLYSYTTNVSLIVSASPLLTTLMSVFFFKKKIGKYLLMGCAISLAGLVLLVFNGDFSYTFHMFGDLIALGASFSWALYCLLIKPISKKYNVVFITRKVFFYGLITVLPMFIWSPFEYPLKNLLQLNVLPFLLYLAVLSSFLCFLGWNFVVKSIGPLKAANLVYLSPVFTFMASYLFLSEPLTFYSLVGALLIIIGVSICENETTD